MNWNPLGTTPLEEQAAADFDYGNLGDDNSSLFNTLNNYNFNLTNSGTNFGFNTTVDYSLPDLSFNFDNNNNNNNNSYFYQPIVSSSSQNIQQQQQQLQQVPFQQLYDTQQQPNHYSIDYTQANDIVSGQIFSIDGQIHSMQSASDYSSPMDHTTNNILSSPSLNLPSTPAPTPTSTTTNVSSPATASPSSSSDDADAEADDSDSSADESDHSDSESRANRPTKKRKNSFDPTHNYGPVLPKNIQLEISSKEFEAYRIKFFSGKVTKDVASSLKSQERKIKNRESAQKSRERKSRNLQDLEEKLKEENVKTSNLEAKLKEASIKNNYLEEEVRRLKAELNSTRNNTITPQPYFNDSCASSSSSTLSSFLSIGTGIPAVAGGQRLACFFLLFLVILFTNSPYNGYYGAASSSIRPAYPFQSQSPSYLTRSTFSIPTKEQLEMIKPFNVLDSRYVYDWQGKSNGEITISYNPNNANSIVKNMLEKANVKSRDLSVGKTTTTTTTTSQTAPTEPQTPTLPSSQHDHFHSTNSDSDSNNGICDVPQLPNNSSVKISIRSNYKITSPDGTTNHSIPSHEDSMVGQHNSEQQFNYKELNVDVELLFPSRIFENGSNEISKLLMSANNGQPLKIVASVLDLDSASSSSSTHQQQQQQQQQKQEQPTFTHKQIDNLD